MDAANLPCRNDDGDTLVVVEAPKGSTVKLKYEPSLRAFTFHRALPLGVAYPYDWGFVPSTIAEDGDPLDAMVLFESPTATGIVVPSRPIGIVRLDQQESGKTKWTRNDRVIFVPAFDHRYDHVDKLPSRVREELERFFVTVVEMTNKRVKIRGWKGPRVAKDLIDETATRYARGRRKA